MMSLASGRPEIAIKSASMALLFTTPASVFLVYRFGLSGAVWSWVFYQVFACLYAVPAYCNECLKIPLTEWYRHLSRILALVASTYGATGVALSVYSVSSLQGITVGYLVASAAFAMGSYFLVSDELRTSLVRLSRYPVKLSRAFT